MKKALPLGHHQVLAPQYIGLYPDSAWASARPRQECRCSGPGLVGGPSQSQAYGLARARAVLYLLYSIFAHPHMHI